MPAVLEQPASLLDSAPVTPATFPAWFAERQRAARQRFLQIPQPKRGDETWRFSSVKELDFADFRPANGGADATLLASRSTGLEAPVAKFVFGNDELLHSESNLPAGVICLPLADALKAFEIASDKGQSMKTQIAFA